MTKMQICGVCGGSCLSNFSNETLFIDDQHPVGGLSGLRCNSCGEIYLDQASQDKYVDASNALVLIRRETERTELARIRKKLGLTQRQAARLTGGGHNAFGRYERGEARALPAVINLFKLLDVHPELLKEISE